MSPTLKSDEKSTTSSRKRNASSSASATPTKKSAPASTPSSKKPIIIVRFLKDYIRTPFPYLILVYIFVVTGSFILQSTLDLRTSRFKETFSLRNKRPTPTPIYLIANE